MVKAASPSPKPPGHEGWSPRTRGWSQTPAQLRAAAEVVPAHAGVVLRRGGLGRHLRGGPRARGGGPSAADIPAAGASWSPRTRGGPSRLPGEWVGRLWSPRTRGWSHDPAGRQVAAIGGPRARGVVPAATPGGRRWRRGPAHAGWSHRSDPGNLARLVVPAHAGVVLVRRRRTASFRRGPRARGGGPVVGEEGHGGGGWSPRTRGWSQGQAARTPPRVVVPAHAGVVLRVRPDRGSRCCGPRARGGGPAAAYGALTGDAWSPRTRGWSSAGTIPAAVAAVVPAHAGVVPSTPSQPSSPRCGPRARGGGPHVGIVTATMSGWSPRTRGWPRVEPRCLRLVIVVPAHAGVVPSGVFTTG